MGANGVECARCRELQAALRLKQHELQQEQAAFEEYRESSAELERELEQELSELERRNAQYKQRAETAEREVEALRRTVQEMSMEQRKLTTQNDACQREVIALRAMKRQWEQEQDELSTRVRVLEATEEDLTHRVECEMEERFFLQSELDETKSAHEVAMEHLRAQLVELQEEVHALRQPTVASAPSKRVVETRMDTDAVLREVLRSPNVCDLPDPEAMVKVDRKCVEPMWGADGAHSRKRLRTTTS